MLKHSLELLSAVDKPVGQELLPPPIIAPLGLAARFAKAFKAPAPAAAPKAMPPEESIASR
ncbi:hypothetical protein B2J93_3079 [Marssonina coronariae]|uniref:Uncharacterized protein n=1 Tax=Diplocarpon coronariae TaxID=2795749 RepID=A0A218Z5Y1_9HELO|nr:hypothetical protein B2J93_3079 [Marssonina coronariae]